VLALTLPIFAVVYWFTIPSGGWLATSVALLAVVAAAFLAVYSTFTNSIELDEDGLQLRWPLRRTRRIRRSDVRYVEMVELYEASTLETEPHLFVVGRGGDLLLRMRGRYWPVAAMEDVCGALDSPRRIESSPTTLAELRHRSPELLTWSQRIFAARR
jgi:hypothetical protein